MKASVVLKLWLIIVAISSSMLLGLALLVPQQMTQLYDFHLSDHMLGQARGLVALYEPDPSVAGTKPWQDLEGILGAEVVTLTAAQVNALGQAPEGQRSFLPPEQAQRLLRGESATYRLLSSNLSGLGIEHADHGSSAEKPDWLFAAGVPIIRDGDPHGALILIAPMNPVAQTIAHSRAAFLWAAAGMLIVVTLVAFYLSNRMARPLRRMNAMAQAMAGGDFRQRVTVAGTDEIAWLGHSINRLADTLDETIARLHENNARLAGVLTSMTDAVILADQTGGCTLMNQPAAHLLHCVGLSCGEPPCEIGRDALNCLGVSEATGQVLQEGRPMTLRVSVAGSVYAVYLAAVRDRMATVRGAVLVWQDITEAERLEQMRRDFVANVSHEMRTPIGVVRGYVEALQDGLDDSPEARAEMLAIMQEELDRVGTLITDLLQLARLDSGEAALSLEPTALGSLMRHLARKLAPLAAETGGRIEVALPPDLPPVLADGDRLEQVLLNLTENALRYSPPGGAVTLGARVDGDHLMITVQDQGPGIPPEERHLVWERFYRGDKAHSRKRGGTGLGLAIVRGIVTNHGGQVWIDEAPGGGSLFCFTLPLAGK